MRAYDVEVLVSLKPAVNDPEGLAIRDGLRSLGFGGIDAVRSGKYLRLHVEAASALDAEERVSAMCQTLLANPVIEQYCVSVREPAAS